MDIGQACSLISHSGQQLQLQDDWPSHKQILASIQHLFLEPSERKSIMETWPFSFSLNLNGWQEAIYFPIKINKTNKYTSSHFQIWPWGSYLFELNKTLVWSRDPWTAVPIRPRSSKICWTDPVQELTILHTYILVQNGSSFLKSLWYRSDLLHHCWWRMLETKCVGDKFEMLVTDLIHWDYHQHNENSRQHNYSVINIWNQSP